MVPALKSLFHKILRSYWRLRAIPIFVLNRIRMPVDLSLGGPVAISSADREGVQIGRGVSIVSSSRYNRAGVNHPTQLVAGAGALLTIGDHTGISGASIYATVGISIGSHVNIGVNCSIYDTDFHPVEYLERRRQIPGNSAPVCLEDDVWLGANVIVLKGVTIGARSVIGAGSVVTKDVPPDCFAAGSPARVVRYLSRHPDAVAS